MKAARHAADRIPVALAQSPIQGYKGRLAPPPALPDHTGCALVFSCEERFALGVGVALASALGRMRRDLRPDVFVFDLGMAGPSKARLARIAARARCPLEFIDPGAARLQELPSVLDAATFARLLVPTILPGRVRRALYLDADVLVRRDLAPLFEIDLGDAPLAAVRDWGIQSTASSLSGIRDRSSARPYFNAGVLVFDTAAARAGRVGMRALEYIAADAHPLRFDDQDALNATVDRWHELDREWNVQLHGITFAKRQLLTDRGGYRAERAVYRRAAVLHFTRTKPWAPTCESRGTFTWVRAARRSGWFEGGEGVRWTAAWMAARARAWPTIARARWRTRLALLRRSKFST